MGTSERKLFIYKNIYTGYGRFVGLGPRVWGGGDHAPNGEPRKEGLVGPRAKGRKLMYMITRDLLTN